MKVAEILNTTDKTLFSFELVPPLKGTDINVIYKGIEPLMEFKPPFINVTYHSDEIEYVPKENGLLKKKIVTKRPGSVALAASIMHRFKVDVVPHLICGGCDKHKIENELIDMNFLGIENIMALRGDPIHGQRVFIPEVDGHLHTSGLVKQISYMNNGIYVDKHLEAPVATNFCIGVAGYPEKHYEAPNLDADIKYLKEKIDLGAEYIVTQLFYDNQKYFDFVDKCRATGINVPIVPGIKPISMKKHIEMLPRAFSIDIPNELVREIEKCKNNAEANRVGIEWAIKQSKELISYGVPVVHYYTMSNSDNVRKIAEAVF